MKKLFIFLIFIFVIAGCSAAKEVDLSKQQLYGFQPNTKLQKEQLPSLTEEQQAGENTLLRSGDDVSFVITPQNTILSIEARSEMKPIDSKDGIRQGDSVDKVVQRFGKSFSTRVEQGSKIYTYQDLKNHLFLEFWTSNDKVDVIRLKTQFK
ncbi:hypothetical protein [Neobacillus sp. D3-1R]|uniref:hypothetical protein n=1 Tax=Neobacillus sp. D3-1R TaxID=3445778 RepID=UPI003FA0C725